MLLFKYVGVMLGDIRGGGRRHDVIEEKAKIFLFCLYIVDLGTIMEFFE